MRFWCWANAANEESYCSIKAMADFVAEMGKVAVKIDENEESGKIFPPELYMNLEVGKLRGLSWRARHSLKDMFVRMEGAMQS